MRQVVVSRGCYLRGQLSTLDIIESLLTNTGQSAFHGVVLKLSGKIGRIEIAFRADQTGDNACHMRGSLEILDMRKSFTSQICRGLAMDVPDIILVLALPPIQALSTLVPGAKTSTTEA